MCNIGLHLQLRPNSVSAWSETAQVRMERQIFKFFKIVLNPRTVVLIQIMKSNLFNVMNYSSMVHIQFTTISCQDSFLALNNTIFFQDKTLNK